MRGGARPGAGRRKGAPNKATKEKRKKIASSGLTPMDYMLSVMRDEKAARAERMQAAKDVAPYCHPRLSTMQHSGPNGGPIQTLDWSKLTDAQLAEAEPFLRAIAAACGVAGASSSGD